MFDTEMEQSMRLIDEAKDMYNDGYKSSAKTRLEIAKKQLILIIHKIGEQI